jgi:tetratricopeptide (TPR) repeat protein
MKSFRNSISCFLIAIIASSVATSSSLAMVNESDAAANSQVVDSFLQHLDSLDRVNDSKKEQVMQAVQALRDTPGDAITEGLLLVYPDYHAAVESSDNDDIEKAIDLLSPLAESADEYLAADASFYLARSLMNSDRFEAALPLLEALTGKFADFTVHQGSSQYFIGVAQAGMLQNKEAIHSLMQFLESNEDAPERLRVSAWRQVQELQAIEEGKLSDVHHHMDYSRRRLELIETGEATQQEQDEIVKMLARLIKEQEKKECNSSCKNNTKKSAQNKPQQNPGKKPKPSKSEQSGTSANPNGKVV